MQFRASFPGLVVRPDMNYTPNGLCVVKWTMPYEVYNSQTKKTDTQWMQCAAFGDRFEKLYTEGYLSAGRTILVSGTIKVNAFLRRDNTAGASLEMTVGNVDFVQISKGSENANPSVKTPSADENPYNAETGGF